MDRVKVGAYVHLETSPYTDPVSNADLTALEGRLGGRFDLVHYFFTWGRSFNEALTSNVDDRELMISLKPDGNLIARIENGLEDEYLTRIADQARAWGRPVYLRFGHEMNGDWMDYSAGRPGGPDSTAFIRAWKHFVGVFRAQGASNVKFVWCPNEKDFPSRVGNRLESYWPGDEWVDIAGFDAYNWTDLKPARGDGRYRQFDEIVQAPYERIARLTRKPMWLCEFGTVEPAKGQWFERMFASRGWPQLTGLIYFSEHDRRDAQRDWRLDSSDDSVRGWRAGRAGRTSP